MKLTMKSAISIFLALSLVFGLFGSIPAMAETTQVDGALKIGNITHLDTSSGTDYTYQQKLDRTTIELNEKYQANLQLSNMIGPALKAKAEDNTNLISKVSYQKYNKSEWLSLSDEDFGKITDMNYYLHDNSTTSSTSWRASAYYELDAVANGDEVLYSQARIDADKYDMLITTELSYETEIEKFLFIAGPNQEVANCTYAIFVSYNKEDLYNAENQVFLFDAYNNYKDGGKWKFNGGASGTARGCESQYLEFTGDSVPKGKYVGIKLYDGAVYDTNDKANSNPVYITDLFISGEKIVNLKFASSDTSYSGTKPYETKLDSLKTSLNYNYNATLQLADLTGDTLASKVTDETNLIAGGEWQAFASKDSDTKTALTATEIADLTDMVFVGNGTATVFGGNSFLKDTGYNTYTYSQYGDSKEILGSDRVVNDRYDMLMTLELKDKTAIDKFYLVGHPNPQLSPFLYTVYVGDSKEDLFSDKNEVFHYDYSDKAQDPGGEAWKFNGSGESGNRTSEIQYLEFTGDSLPTGKYVGIKFYDTSYSSFAECEGAFNLLDVGVFGDTVNNVWYADKFVDNDISSDITETIDTKLALLNATSKYSGTELRMTALNKDYVNNLVATSGKENLIKSAKIKNYTAADFTAVKDAVIANVTDGGIAYGNGSSIVNAGTNSYIGSSGKSGLFYDGEHHGAARVKNDVYDALISLDLGNTTEISDFYMFNHINPHTAIATYKVYVSDSASDLFEAENEIVYWDYYNGYSDKGKKYLLNSGSVSGNIETRRSEGQHWKFIQDKPHGRYVGVKVYEASTIDANDFLTIYEIGVLGTQNVVPTPHSITFNHSEAVKVQAPETEIAEGASATFTITKAENVNITSVTAGDKEITETNGIYTINNVTSDLAVTITTDMDSQFPDALGMYNGIDITKNSSFYGKALWEGDTVYAETVTLYEGKNNIKLAYPVDNIVSVRSYDLQKYYLYGVDYTIENGKLVLTEGTTIPVCSEEYVNVLTDTNAVDFDKVSTLKSNLYKYQIAVTYTHSDTWGNNSLYETKPEGKLSTLSNLYEKLKNGEEVTVVFYGDSTTLGCDASGLNEKSLGYSSGADASTLNQRHFTTYGIFGANSMPDWACDTWAVQVVNELAQKFGTKVNIINKAVGSSTSIWGSKDANMQFLLQDVESPDLMVIAYGGNDRNNSSDTMNKNIGKIIDYVRENKAADCDIVVNSTFKRGYPKLTENLATHEVGYYQLEEAYDNLVVIPVYSYTESLMTDVKEPLDYTSNGYNHMSDFGQRLYASVVSGVLSEKEYTVSFTDKFYNVFYTAVVSERNPVLSSEQILAATTAVPSVYGYNFVGWNDDIEAEFSDNAYISALYQRDTTVYTTSFTNTAGNVQNTDVQFDQRFTLKDENAKSFLVDGQIIGGAQSVTLYGCGDISITASEEVAPNEVSIAILKTITNEKANGKNVFRVFVHLYNPNESEVDELGVMFAPGSVYTDDTSFTQELLNEKSFIALSTDKSTSDLLATFGDIKSGVTRVVRAYATINDENTYSAKVYSHTFN